MRGILYVRFAEKARPVRTVISSLTGVLGTIRLRSHPNPKVSLTVAERAMRLAVPPSGSFTAAAVAYFPLSVLSFLTSSPYFLSLRGVGEESISRGKSKTKTSPCGLVFVFREIIEFKFKRVYLRSFFIETSEPDAI